MNRAMAKTQFTVLVLMLMWLWSFTVRTSAQDLDRLDGLSAAEEQRLHLLSDPEALKKARGSDQLRPPFEIYRTQVAPSDVLPWVKAWHWHSMTLELSANLGDFEGNLRTTSVPVVASSFDLSFGRDARLVKEQRSRLGFQFLLPQVVGVRELPLELVSTGALRPEQVYTASVRAIAPHQMLVLVLSKDSNDAYAAWNRMNATIPTSLERGDLQGADALRYYRLILPLEVDRPLLPTHPLTWTTISHIVWDGLDPNVLSVTQQSAMIDWIHWGGQLIVMGGAGPKFSILRDSFLEPYLPADATGDGRSLDADDLQALSKGYRPPPGYVAPASVDDRSGRLFQPLEETIEPPAPVRRPFYGTPAPIHQAGDRPIHSAGLRARAGSTVVAAPEREETVLAIERRVGRGRISMLTINPTDPALAKWEGIDTLVRRLVFRRPEEASVNLGTATSTGMPVPSMQGPDLSWYRIATRDLELPADWSTAETRRKASGFGSTSSGPAGGDVFEIDFSSTSLDEDRIPALTGVAEWRDESNIPRLCRDALEAASGIKVPSSSFVFKVILAYILAVVPLNWLFCRFVLRRKEAAWIIVPLLAFGFAGAVERVAAYDLGFDAAGDELDILELQADHPRGHLSRFVSLYSTGHGRFSIRFPDEPTALALPLATGRSIAGEDRSTSTWRSFPVPSLEGFAVQPRSLAMFRGEQMLTLPGPIVVDDVDGVSTLYNGSGLELRDAVLLERAGSEERRERFLGTIPPDAAIRLEDEPNESLTDVTIEGFDGPNPSTLLDALRVAWEDRPEAEGELRLVAWTPGPAAGSRIEPSLDRHRGVTVVVAHLRYGPPPSPNDVRYDRTKLTEK